MTQPQQHCESIAGDRVHATAVDDEP